MLLCMNLMLTDTTCDFKYLLVNTEIIMNNFYYFTIVDIFTTFPVTHALQKKNFFVTSVISPCQTSVSSICSFYALFWTYKPHHHLPPQHTHTHSETISRRGSKHHKLKSGCDGWAPIWERYCTCFPLNDSHFSPSFILICLRTLRSFRAAAHTHRTWRWYEQRCFNTSTY